ncbi:MAG: MBL fold metallo-hydrolase [Anaerolineaceae bacterium]|nr:MBL fold metallo-hydrolase [Anaerolineaceae bacterium]
MAVNQFTEKVPGLYELEENGQVIVWLIVGSEKVLLIDTGFGAIDYHQKVREISDLPIMLVNTHIHPDHAAGNGQFDLAYCGKNDLPLLQVTSWNIEFTKAKQTLPLVDGDLLDLGGITIEVVEVPGHTPGSIALLWEERGILITGDTVNASVWLHLEHSLPLSVYSQSMEKLIGMSHRFSDIYASHVASANHFTVDTVRHLKEMVDAVISGEKTGVLAKTHLGHKAYHLIEDGIGFFYDPKKLK